MTATATEELTGAQLKVTLGALGLPPIWFAQHCGVAMRTVVRWCDGETVPSYVAEKLETLCDETLAEMLAEVEKIEAAGDKSVVLQTYRTDDEIDSVWPALWHRQLTFRVTEHLRAQDYSVRIEYA